MVLLEWFSVRAFLLHLPGVTLKIQWDLNETWDDHEAQLACNFKHSKMCSHSKYFFLYLVLSVTVVAIVAYFVGGPASRGLCPDPPKNVRGISDCFLEAVAIWF